MTDISDDALRTLCGDLRMQSNALAIASCFDGDDQPDAVRVLRQSADAIEALQARAVTLTNTAKVNLGAFHNMKAERDAALADVARHTARFEKLLADFYRLGHQVDVGRMCDEELDRSGALLGRVRNLAVTAPENADLQAAAGAALDRMASDTRSPEQWADELAESMPSGESHD